MDILIISHFISAPGESGNNRFRYLSKMLSENNNVEQVTSSFSHATKRQREQVEGEEITLIYEPGYQKHVSLKRLYSHSVMGRKLKKYLAGRKKPEVIYCAVPSLSAAYAAARYARKKKVRFLIDVQDLWPEAFRLAFPIPILSSAVFLPMRWMADFVYRQADGVIAVSETYLNRVMEINRKCTGGLSVFLGTDKEMFDQYRSSRRLSETDGVIHIAYIGTLGHSYDLTGVFDALKILKERGTETIRFLVMGDGPLKIEFQQYAEQKGIPVEFTGKLPYPQMIKRLTECDIAVNPIRRGTSQSIINKVGDYAMAGLPVISTQECQEYQNLLNKYQCGIHCANGDAEALAAGIADLAKNREKRNRMGENSRRLGEELFDRKKTYPAIVTMILEGRKRREDFDDWAPRG